MKNYLKLLCMAATLLLAACFTSPKDVFVKNLSEFCEQVKSEHQNYSSNDLQLVSEQYLAFREEASIYTSEFTAEDKVIVEECYRSLNEIIARSFVTTSVGTVKGYLDEAINLIEDLSGKSVTDFVNSLSGQE